ncbi:MAG: hypothetical protein AVDCRST_MAG43-1630, partial [uncultured Thermomicrobiales bacterium]
WERRLVRSSSRMCARGRRTRTPRVMNADRFWRDADSAPPGWARG